MSTWGYILNGGAIIGAVLSLFRLWSGSLNLLDHIVLTIMVGAMALGWAVEMLLGKEAA